MSAGRVADAAMVVEIGSRVRVQGDDDESEFVMVEPAGEDVDAGRLSSASPLGRAVLGAALGAVVTVAAPGGDRVVRIVRIAAPASGRTC
jgi:transcription elongation factor GreA